MIYKATIRYKDGLSLPIERKFRDADDAIRFWDSMLRPYHQVLQAVFKARLRAYEPAVLPGIPAQGKCWIEVTLEAEPVNPAATGPGSSCCSPWWSWTPC